MNEKLNKILDLMIEGIEKGSQFAKDQLPQLASEILKYESWNHSLWMAIWIAVAIFFLLLVIMVLHSNEPEMFFIPCIPVIACVMFAFYQFSELKKIELAPKYYLIEMVQSSSKCK